jgi:4-hydroxy-tetrahydrodipicolinate synthase
MATTLLTPFDAAGDVDEAALRRLVDFQIESGVTRLCPTGVTGEAAALLDTERLRILEVVLDQAHGRALVIPDIGTECLARTLILAKEAERLGADAVLAFTPYLDPPTDEGLIRYYNTVADAVTVPLFLHNLPGRTLVDIKPEQVSVLASHPNIAGMKEGNGDIVRLNRVLQVTRDLDFVVLSGNDFLALPAMLMGAHGHISVAGNVIPRQVAAIVGAALQGDFVTARDLYMKYSEFYRAVYFATNPIALKKAFSLAHFEVGDPRVPLTPLSEHLTKELEATMYAKGIL